MMNLFNPLEQFRVYPIIHFGNEHLSFTNSAFFLLVALSFVTAIFYSASKDVRLAPVNAWQTVGEMFYKFINDIILDIIGPKGRPYFPFFFFLFLFIFSCNLFGLIPYSFTVTSHIIVTFTLALAIFMGINVIGIRTHKSHFFSLFMPSGISLALAPFIISIELVSYLSRVFSLSIRLFANMLAGHSLLKILASFSWSMLLVKGVIALFAIFPFIIVFGITGLELAIAFLQAYVFTVLSVMYLNDAIQLH